MNEFRDKDAAIDCARRDIRAEFSDLHPVDRVDAYRTIEKEAGRAATRLAETNDREGVPEHPRDIEKRAALDGGLGGQR